MVIRSLFGSKGFFGGTGLLFRNRLWKSFPSNHFGKGERSNGFPAPGRVNPGPDNPPTFFSGTQSNAFPKIGLRSNQIEAEEEDQELRIQDAASLRTVV